MPYVYFGKKNFFLGKTLWEIVGNLKNFGAGRILVRSKFEKRYPEVTYMRILRAEPLMDEVRICLQFWSIEIIFTKFFLFYRKIFLEEFGLRRSLEEDPMESTN